MTPYRSRRKRSPFPKQKRTGRRLSGPRKEKRQEKTPQNPSRNPLREPSSLQSSGRIRSDRTRQSERKTGPQAEQQTSGFYRVSGCNLCNLCNLCFSCSEESEKRPVPGGSLALLDRSLLSSYLSAKIRQHPKLARLREEQLLEVLTITRGGSPTLAALLQFGIYPQGTFPDFCILADDPSRFRQPERRQDVDCSIFPRKSGKSGCSVRIEGTLQEMAQEAVLFCRKALSRHCDIRGEDDTRNLLSALQETLWRALLFRDYSACSGHLPIRLSVFSDRIELHVPVSSVDPKPSRNPLLRAMAFVMTAQERNRNGENGNDVFDFMSFTPDPFPTSEFSFPEPGYRGNQGKPTQDPFLKRRESIENDDWHIVLPFDSGASGTEKTEKAEKAELSGDIFRGSDEKMSVQEEILAYCFFPRSRQEIADRIGKKTGQYIIKRYVMPLVEAGKMAMTLPEKPRSKLQRFYTVR